MAAPVAASCLPGTLPPDSPSGPGPSEVGFDCDGRSAAGRPGPERRSPAGRRGWLNSGTQATKALGGQYCVSAYAPADVKFAFNAQSGARVTAAGQYAVLAAPSDGEAGDQVTLPSGQVITIQAGDLAFALTCDLFSTGKVRPIGCAVRNVYQYIGGVLTGTNASATSSV